MHFQWEGFCLKARKLRIKAI